MSFGISKHPIIPGRAEPSDKTEMVTQILFGETYRVVTVEKQWLLIENDADAYQCWIDKKQHTEISECPKSDFTSIKRCGDAIGQITNNVCKAFLFPAAHSCNHTMKVNLKLMVTVLNLMVVWRVTIQKASFDMPAGCSTRLIYGVAKPQWV